MKSDGFRACPGPWLGFGDLLASFLRPGQGLPQWPHFAGRHVRLASSGRAAIFAVREVCGLALGEEVLMPSYNCGTEVDALLKSGLRLRFYEQGADLSIDLDSLQAVATPQTRALYVIHYFGWPQPLRRVEDWCRNRGIQLVEDCALALFSIDSESRPVGTAGSAAVFSFGKSLAVPDGGALTWTGGGSSFVSGKPSSRRRHILHRSLGLARRSLERRWRSVPGPPPPEAIQWDFMAASKASGADARPDMPADYYYCPRREGFVLSRPARGTIARVHPGEVVACRRRNYEILWQRLEGIEGVSRLLGLPPRGACPLLLPVLVDNRAGWLRALARAGITSSPWWSGHHRDVPWDRFPKACHLKNHLLPLPVHHQLNEDDMVYLSDTVKAIAVATGRKPPGALR